MSRTWLSKNQVLGVGDDAHKASTSHLQMLPSMQEPMRRWRSVLEIVGIVRLSREKPIARARMSQSGSCHCPRWSSMPLPGTVPWRRYAWLPMRLRNLGKALPLSSSGADHSLSKPWRRRNSPTGVKGTWDAVRCDCKKALEWELVQRRVSRRAEEPKR